MRAQNLILLAAVATAVVCAEPFAQMYLSHSFNDFALIKNNLRKGVRFFKMDLAAATYDSCVQHSTWRGERDAECSLVVGYGVPVCCLAFRGDLSSRPVFTQPFNTSDDFLAFITAPENSAYFSKSAGNATTKYFFINVMDKMNSQWGAFVNFYYDLFQTITRLDLNIKIGTDSWGPFLEINSRCFYDRNCTPKEQYISDYPIIFQSDGGDPLDPFEQFLGYSRIGNFNSNLNQFAYFCQNGFPKWTQNVSLPLVVWEPSLENNQQYFQQLLANNCSQLPESKRYPGGVVITSNQFVEMFEVFYKQIVPSEESATKRPNSPVLNDTQKTFFAHTRNPHLEYMDVRGTSCVVTLLQNDRFSRTTVIRAQDAATGAVHFEVQVNENIVSTSSLGVYLLIRTQTSTVVYEQKNDTNTCTFVQRADFDGDDSCLAQTLIDVTGQGVAIATLRVVNSQYSLAVNTLDDFSLVHEYALDALQSVSPDTIEDSVSLAGGVDSAFITYSLRNETRIKFVYGLPILLANGTLSVPGGARAARTPLAYGTRPRAKQTVVAPRVPGNGAKQYLLLSFEDAACQAGVLLNNDGTNKCDPSNNLQDESALPLLNVPRTLGYAFARFDAFVDVYEREQDARTPLVTACTQTISQAKYYLGKNGNLALRVDGDVLSAVALHETANLSEQSILSTLACGSTVAQYPAETGTLLYYFGVSEF